MDRKTNTQATPQSTHKVPVNVNPGAFPKNLEEWHTLPRPVPDDVQAFLEVFDPEQSNVREVQYKQT